MSGAPFDHAAPSVAFGAAVPPEASARRPAGAAARRGPPTVAILCSAAHGAPVATALALALAHASGAPCGIAAALGHGPAPARSLAPSARRAARALRERNRAAAAIGGAVWLADGAAPEADSEDPAGAAAALSTQLLRAAQTLAAPAAVALPCARSAGLDRVLAWHDAIVVVRDARTGAALAELVRASLGALGRPVAVVDVPTRLGALGAASGLHVPAFAVGAVAALGLSGEPR